MKPNKLYLFFSASIFAMVGIAHLWRALAAWPVVLGSLSVPLVVSWVAGILALALSGWGFSQLRRA